MRFYARRYFLLFNIYLVLLCFGLGFFFSPGKAYIATSLQILPLVLATVWTPKNLRKNPGCFFQLKAGDLKSLELDLCFAVLHKIIHPVGLFPL